MLVSLHSGFKASDLEQMPVILNNIFFVGMLSEMRMSSHIQQ